MRRPSLNWLLVAVPVPLLGALLGAPSVFVFAAAAVAVVPLARLISQSTESLATYSGPRVGGLLNATFGNLTELIIGISLIAGGQIEVVKASLIGSILGMLLLVLGAAFLAGGLRHEELRFSSRSAGIQSTSLLLALLGLLMPALFVIFNPAPAAERETISLVVAIVLIALYIAALVFTQITHAHLFRRPGLDQEARWSRNASVLILLASAVTVGIEAELLVRALQPTVDALGISKLFVGLFIVAIVGNAAENGSAVVFALRDRTDVTLEIAFGSSTQIALFVAPLLVILSLLIGRPMDFIFSPFEVAAVGLSTLIVGVIVLDGRSNWLEGAQLLGAYLILAVSFFFAVPAGR